MAKKKPGFSEKAGFLAVAKCSNTCEQILMAIPSQLRERGSAIAERWLRDSLATYSDDATKAFKRNKDPFTNPVGHALRVGTLAAVEALLDGKDVAEICSCLDDVIKMRAVQEFTASQALSFVFSLKNAIRSELGSSDGGSTASCEAAELEEKIDRLALRAFDVYLAYREQVYDLRVNEVKRGVSTLVERLYGRGADPAADVDLVQLTTSERTETQRGGDQ